MADKMDGAITKDTINRHLNAESSTVPHKAYMCQQLRLAIAALTILMATTTCPQAAEKTEALVWVETSDKQIPAMLNTGGNTGAILLLHDTTSNVTDKAFIEPLRRQLPERGWDVLAVRLPTTEITKNQDKYIKLLQLQTQRLQAGINFLTEKGYQSIALAGHGFGAYTVLQAARNATEETFAAAILINIRWHSYPKGRDGVIFGIEESTVPILDIAAKQANPQVTKNHARRKAATEVLSSKQDNINSRHLVIPLARQDMEGADEIAARVISNWLTGQLELPH